MAQESQTELPVAAARRGDPQAWDTLLRRYQLPLFTYVMDLVHHRDTALDLVQETFVRASRHLSGLRDDSRFGSWLFGIAHRQAILYWRRQGRSPFSDDPIPEVNEDTAPSPDLKVIRDEDAAALLEAIDRLPAPQRSVFLLHFLEDFTLADIADITGTSRTFFGHWRCSTTNSTPCPPGSAARPPASRSGTRMGLPRFYPMWAR